MTTWNPSDKSSTITLSNGNLTATGNASAGGVRGTTSYPSAGGAKLYFECTATDVAGITYRLGLALSTHTLTNGLGASPADSLAWDQSSGAIRINGSNIATAVTYTTGDILQFAIDFTNNNIWVAKNGGNWNNSGTANPSTNIGGISIATLNAGSYFIAFTNTQTNLNSATMAPTGSTYGPPSGFTAWDAHAPPANNNSPTMAMMGVG